MIVPSLIAKNGEELLERYDKIKDVTDIIHLDVMDGKFVEAHSLDFEFMFHKEKFVEMHLMVKEPEYYVIRHLDLVDMFILQVECEDLEKIISTIKAKNKKVAIAINPGTDVEKLAPYLKKVDQITVMTVVPGNYGAPFVPETLEKVKWIRKQNSSIEIECDGHMTVETIPQAKASGATKFIAESVLQNSNDVATTMKELERAENGND